MKKFINALVDYSDQLLDDEYCFGAILVIWLLAIVALALYII